MKQVFLVNPEKDKSLVLQAFRDNNYHLPSFRFSQLIVAEDLLNKLCQIVNESFTEVQALGLTSTHKEAEEGSYRSMISSLVFYKWNLDQAGLLDLWADLGCRLARNQCFTNGNKRTALLVVRNFIYECGFRLPDAGFPAGWEKLFVAVAQAESEEIAQELIKQKIWSEILL